MMEGWSEIRARPRASVVVAGRELGRGSRVRLRPSARGDIFDLVLAGRTAVVEAVEEDVDGNVQLAVTVDDDPGADLGAARQIGHRFFFSPAELEPLDPAASRTPVRRVLIAGIGNVFMGDDGFGVELARRLGEGPLPAGVEVKDFGIRGMDLAYALGEGWEAVVLLDAVPHGAEPGSICVIEPDARPDELSLDTHGMDPARVLRLACELGPLPPRVLLLGCEPALRMTGTEDEVVADLSPPVRAALDYAVPLVEQLVAELTEPKEEPA
jgi:hydrogenase maturation protease